MKKLLLFFVVAFLSVGAKAQTFDQTQSRIGLQSAKLESELQGVKNRIFYLEVTVPDRLQKSKNLAEIQQLKKEAYFSKDEVVQLKVKKTELENSLQELTKTKLASIDYRTDTDLKSNLPERMRPREYAQRVRANDLKSEASNELFKGILINHKTGLGEKAVFYIFRKGVSGIPPKIISLNPQEKFVYYLPAGDYIIKVICGYKEYAIEAHARPNEFKWVDGQQYSWFAEKLLAD